MNTKSELLWGVLSIILITVVMYVFSVQYNKESSQTIKQPVIPISSSTDTSGIILSGEQVKSHNVSSDCWLIIQDKVYQATEYLSKHPGGADRIIPYCGADATQPFLTQGGKGTHSQAAFQDLGILYLGDLNGTVLKQPDKKAIESIPVRREEEEDDDD